MSELRIAKFELGAAPVEVPPPVPPELSAGAVYEMLAAEPGYLALAVVEREVPIGLVNRVDLLASFAKPFVRELYGQRPIRHLMDDKPLIVPVEADVEDVTRAIAERNTGAMQSGWIWSRDGAYAGIGNSLRLLHHWIERMERRNRELENARRFAEQASEAKSRFLATVSHELRTPLNAIIGFSELMAGELYGPLGDRRYHGYAGDIRNSGQHLLALINDILDLSKTEAGHMELDESEVEIGQVMESAAHLIRQQAHRGGVELVLPPPATGGLVRADRRKLTQVLLNLLSNAVKFTPRGGRVSLEALFDPAGRLRLTVRDTGIGMREADLAQALTPFGQVDNRLGRKYEGTGLGLPLAKAMTELHGGALLIASAPGHGTTVTVELPASRTLSAAEPQRRIA